MAAIAGTGIHLLGWDLPAPEFMISASVLALGILLTRIQSSALGLSLALSGLAGLFHGYAYGESIVGAEMTPLWAYLTGFTLIQLAVAGAAMKFGQSLLSSENLTVPTVLRYAGFTICGAGAAFLSGVVLG